jgi:phenylpropionate dioxygenase-like ring-hydroxylating dioxygenase large terminal subunit
MNPLSELANTTWLRLEDLLKDLDNSDKERQAFLDDSRQFFEQRLSIYEQQRNELENHINKLSEQMDQLSDELQIPRIIYNNNQMNLIEKRKFINENIDHLKNMIFQRDKELILLRQSIQIKANLIGNTLINTDEVRIFNSGLLTVRKNT